MQKSLPWLVALGLGVRLALTPIVSGQAAPARSMLTGLDPLPRGIATATAAV
jgi:hypothetical protein